MYRKRRGGQLIAINLSVIQSSLLQTHWHNNKSI